MATEQELKEEYIILAGWEKKKGFRITNEQIDTDYDYCFFEESEREEIIKENCSWWADKEENHEAIYEDEDIDDLIDKLEDYDGAITFEEFKKRKLEVKK